MGKIAVFVEGQAELIFVREYVQRITDYTNIYGECYTLETDHNAVPTEYKFGSENADRQVNIYNVQGDGRVLSAMNRREQNLLASGFDKIIGLRDMYSEQYIEANGGRTINHELNQRFIEGMNDQIGPKPHYRFIFAIMEIEAWLLGIDNFHLKLNKNLTIENLETEFGFNIADIDPETHIFHPANTLSKLNELAGLGKYTKHHDQVNGFVGCLVKQDFKNLLNSQKCNSFKLFHEALSL